MLEGRRRVAHLGLNASRGALRFGELDYEDSFGASFWRMAREGHFAASRRTCATSKRVDDKFGCPGYMQFNCQVDRALHEAENLWHMSVSDGRS